MFSHLSPQLLVLACLVAVLRTSGLPIQAGETLAMKFEAGETYAYRIASNVTVEGEGQGQKFGSEMGQTLFVRTHVNSVDDDGSAHAEQIIDRVKIKVVLSGPLSQTVEYDTDAEEDPASPIAKQMAARFSKMVGEAISMTISPQGRMHDVVLPEDLGQSQPPGAAGPGGGDQLKQMFEQSGLRLSDEEVAVGDTWKHDMNLKLPFGTMLITTVYTYQGTNDEGLHKIGAAMDVRLEPSENPQAKVTAEAKEATGSFLFDNESGKVRQSTVKQVMELDINGQIKQNVTTVVTMELLDGSGDSQ